MSNTINQQLKNEKIQVILRIILAIFTLLTLPMFDSDILDLKFIYSISILEFVSLVTVFNIIYYFFLLKYPNFFMHSRLVLAATFDIVVSVWLMNIVGYYSMYYPFLLLWYIIGYSTRYGNKTGYFVYVFTLTAWVILVYTTPVWRDNLPMSIGWFIAYLIIPLYTFKLVNELHLNINKLHDNLEISTYQAAHDSLTSLANRKHFDEELAKKIAQNSKFALVFIDLDGFKEINDTYGHDTGDKVLVEVSQRLKNFNYFVARLGGDEFVSIIEYEDEKRVVNVVEDMLLAISTACLDLDVDFSASIGVSLFLEDSKTSHELKQQADIAMYRAKEDGKNRVKFYRDI